MATLHLVRTSAYSDNLLALCIDVCQTDDSIIFVDDGCYNLTHSLIHDELIQQLNLYFIAAHGKARNMKNADLTAIELDALLSMSFSHNNVITWQ